MHTAHICLTRPCEIAVIYNRAVNASVCVLEKLELNAGLGLPRGVIREID